MFELCSTGIASIAYKSSIDDSINFQMCFAYISSILDDSKQFKGIFCPSNMHNKVPINVAAAVINVLQRYSKPLMHFHKVKITHWDTCFGTFACMKNTLELWCIIVTFVLRIVCFSPMLPALYCSDFYIMFESIFQNRCS